MKNTAILLIKCPDRPGIVAAISSFLYRHGANIVDLDQHSTEDDPGVYFMRLELHSVDDLKAMGRDLERRVLVRAVKWHCENRVIVHENKTVVFV